MDEEPTLSKRARRAVPLMGAALIVVLVVGTLFLRASAPSPTAAVTPSPTIPRLSAPYAVAYDFVSRSVGWAAVTDQNLSRFWIFKTTDGARHWLRQFEAQSWLGRNYIHFFDTVHGVAYGAQLYRTADGGAHWQLVNSPGPGPFFAFAGPDRAWEAVFKPGEPGHLFSTTDGGATWVELQTRLPGSVVMSPFGNFRSFEFRESGEGWVGSAGPRPMVYMTTEAGARWQTISLPVTTSSYAAYITLVRLVPRAGVLVVVSTNFGPPLAAFASVDHGRSWREVSLPDPMFLPEASFLDATHWWASRSGLLYKTDNAGLTWKTTIMFGIPYDWNDEAAHAIDANHGWLPLTYTARSSDSALAMTSDGGLRWTPVNVPRPG